MSDEELKVTHGDRCAKCKKDKYERHQKRKTYHAYCYACYNQYRHDWREQKRITLIEEEYRGMTDRAIKEVKRLEKGLLTKLCSKKEWNRVVQHKSLAIKVAKTPEEIERGMVNTIIKLRKEFIKRMGDWDPTV